ncbi:MAG: MFS transporter [Clostridiales bacterium]|nr:MFS transporter [Clostridiales bacterium]
MVKKSGALKGVYLNPAFIQTLIGQGIMELGDNFRLMAVIALILQYTGSGLAAGFSLVAAPIVGIILSPIAGIFGDRLEARKLLPALYLVQGILTVFFIKQIPLVGVYGILIVFAGVQAIQDPVFRKVIKVLLDDGEIVTGNSFSIGVSGFSNLAGPILGGICISRWGINKVFMIGAFFYGLSSLIVFSISGLSRHMGVGAIASFKQLGGRGGPRDNKSKPGGFLSEVGAGIKYFWKRKSIRGLAFAGFVFAFGAASVSFAFYSFAFDTLGVSATGWGFILSIFYSTRMLAMFISIIMGKTKAGRRKVGSFLTLPLITTCLAWLLYGFTAELPFVVFLLILEGTSHFLFEIFLWSGIQISSEETIVARVVGINNILANTARILGMIFTYFIARVYGTQIVFILNSIIMFLYIIYRSRF